MIAVCLLFMQRHDEAVGVVLAFIDDADIACGFVFEDEEIVVGEVHLQNGLLGGHGANGEGFAADVEFRLLLDLLGGRHLDEGCRAQSLFEAGLIAADLSLDHVDRPIDGIAEVILGALTAEHRACGKNGDFNGEFIFVFTERDGGIGGFLVKELFKLLELTLGQCLPFVKNGDLSRYNGNLHRKTSFCAAALR